MHDNPYQSETTELAPADPAQPARIRWRIIPVIFFGGAGVFTAVWRGYFLSLAMLSNRPWFPYRFNFAIQNAAGLAFGLGNCLFAALLWRRSWKLAALTFALLILARLAIRLLLTGPVVPPGS